MTDTLPSADPLPAFISALEDDPEAEMDLEPEQRRWRVEDLSSAEWAMSKWREAELRRLAVIAQAQAWKDRIDSWLEHELTPIRRSQEFFEGHLIDYARRRREADPNAKTLTLPSGKVASRSCEATVAVEDTAAFVAWAEEVGAEHLLRYEAKPIMAEVKAELKIVENQARWLDEPVPGTIVRPSEVRFSVKPT